MLSVENNINSFFSSVRGGCLKGKGEYEVREEIWKSYKKISNEYQQTYNGMSSINRIVLVLKSLFKETTLTKFQKFDKECKKIYAKTYDGEILLLKKKIESSKSGSLKKKFLEKTMSVSKKNIREDKTGEGFVYQVKNKDGIVVGHLIGTIHATSKLNRNIIITDPMKEAIKKSSTIITELGTSILGNIIQYSAIDGKITRYAWKKGKKIEGFETAFEQFKIMFQAPEVKKLLLEPTLKILKFFNLKFPHKNFGTLLSLGSILNPYDVEMHALVDKWKKGDELAVEMMSNKASSELLEKRNKNWLEGKGKQEGLVEKLSKADENSQICVAVGYAHLFGWCGLITELESEGFNIERVEKTQ